MAFEEKDYMVFTEWGIVVEMIGNMTTIKETDAFLAKVEAGIETEYDVFYNKVKKTFTLFHNRARFEIILPPHDQEMFNNGENSPLVEELFGYSVRTEYKKERLNKKDVFETKIKYLDSLGSFNDIETEELETYIEHLHNKQRTTKDRIEKNQIESRLSLLAEVIGRRKQDGMKLAYDSRDTIDVVYAYIKELMTLANKLSYENRKAVIVQLVKIVDQCEQINNNNQKAISNLRKKLDGIKELIEKYSKEEITSLESDLKSVVSELDVYNDENKKEM